MASLASKRWKKQLMIYGVISRVDAANKTIETIHPLGVLKAGEDLMAS